MYYKERVYLSGDDNSRCRQVVDKMVVVLSRISSIEIKKVLYNIDGNTLSSDAFYNTNNIPVRLKDCINKKYSNEGVPTHTMGEVRAYLYFAVNDIDMIITIGTRSGYIIQTMAWIDGRNKCNVEYKNKNDCANMFNKEYFTNNTRDYLMKWEQIIYADVILGFSENLDNFMLTIHTNAENSTSLASHLYENNITLQIGYIKTKNNNFYLLPCGVITFSPSNNINMVTKPISVIDAYRNAYSNITGDKYTNKTPVYDIDILNDKIGYVDTLDKALCMDLFEFHAFTGGIINLNGKNYMRIVNRFFHMNKSTYSATSEIYMEV